MGLFDRRRSFGFFNEFNDGIGNPQPPEEEEDEIETMDDDTVEEETPTEEPTQEPPADGDEEIETIDDDNMEEEQTPQADTEETPTDTNPDTEGENGNDNMGEETPADGGQGEDEELETIDSDNDGMEGDPAGGEYDGEGSGMETGTDPHQKLKDLEAEVFDQLSDQQKEIKKKELKSLFILIIEKCDNISRLIVEIPKTDQTIRLVDYVSNTLMDLKTYLKDYVTDTYDNCTYLQNSVNFQKFLTIFDSIRAVFEDIKNATTDFNENNEI